MEINKNAQPLVSIVMPAYNAAEYIEEAINSVLNQNYQEWELFIIDDCSTDETLSIAKKFTLKNDRIVLMSQDFNQGVANARNIGIDKANGKYLAFLDSDDYWHSEKLAKQIDYMETNNYDFSHTSVEVINEKSERLNKYRRVQPIIDYGTLLKGNSINCLSVVVNKQKIEEVKMPHIKHEDYATWLNILKKDSQAYGLDEVLGFYRVSNKSLSSNKIKTLSWTWNIYYNHQNLGFLKSSKYLTYFIINTLKKYYFTKKN